MAAAAAARSRARRVVGPPVRRALDGRADARVVHGAVAIKKIPVARGVALGEAALAHHLGLDHRVEGRVRAARRRRRYSGLRPGAALPHLGLDEGVELGVGAGRRRPAIGQLQPRGSHVDGGARAHGVFVCLCASGQPRLRFLASGFVPLGWCAPTLGLRRTLNPQAREAPGAPRGETSPDRVRMAFVGA